MKDGAEFEVIGDPEELKKEQEQTRVKDESVSTDQGTSEAAETKLTQPLQPTTCKFSCIIPIMPHQS